MYFYKKIPMPESRDKKLPPLFIIQATFAFRNFLKRIVRNMLPAGFVLLEEISAVWKVKCIALAAQLDIAGCLQKGPLTSVELASMTNTNAETLYRMLRALAGDGIFKELPGKRFKNTGLSKAMLDKKNTVRYFVMHHLGETNWQVVGDLMHCIKTGENAITYKYNTDPFSFLRSNPEESNNFNKAMTETAELSGNILVNSYPFGKYKNIVDIGGGQGHLLSQILLKHVMAKGTLFDRPEVVHNLSPDSPIKKVQERIAITGGDFFNDKLPEGDLFIMKNIIHDWDDDRSITLLKHTASFMQTGNRLLLIETIIKPDNKPSFGKYLDIQMMIITRGGRERTLHEYKTLIEKSGLNFVRVIHNATPFSIIEIENRP
jgi:hypothetical protein